jgi:hypothetical protein
MLRFLCEHVSALPLGVVVRLLDTHDMLLGVVPLLENPPWTRRLASVRVITVLVKTQVRVTIVRLHLLKQKHGVARPARHP